MYAMRLVLDPPHGQGWGDRLKAQVMNRHAVVQCSAESRCHKYAGDKSKVINCSWCMFTGSHRFDTWTERVMRSVHDPPGLPRVGRPFKALIFSFMKRAAVRCHYGKQWEVGTLHWSRTLTCASVSLSLSLSLSLYIYHIHTMYIYI